MITPRTNIQCPCFRCKNKRFWNVNAIKLLLLKKGFVQDYYQWDRYREPYIARGSAGQSSTSHSNNFGDGNKLMYNMVMDGVGPNFDPNYEHMPNSRVQKIYDILKNFRERVVWSSWNFIVVCRGSDVEFKIWSSLVRGMLWSDIPILQKFLTSR